MLNNINTRQADSDLNKVNKVLSQFHQYSDSAMIRPQVAKDLLGISIATLWRLIRDKKLIAYRLTPRTTTIRAGDLRDFMSAKAGV